MTDILILLALALIGVIDCNLERYTGQGIIGHVADWMERSV